MDRIPKAPKLDEQGVDVIFEFSKRVVIWWNRFQGVHKELERHMLALESMLSELESQKQPEEETKPTP